MKVGKKETGKCIENNNNEITENKVIGSDSEDSENISDNHNGCLLYTSRCV